MLCLISSIYIVLEDKIIINVNEEMPIDEVNLYYGRLLGSGFYTVIFICGFSFSL